MTISHMVALYLAVVPNQPAPHQGTERVPAHCGIIYHLPDGSADRIFASYRDARFSPDTLATLPLRQRLTGRSSSGKRVRVILDSLNTSDNPFPSQYHASIVAALKLDSAETVLFCVPALPISILSTRPGLLDSIAARAIRSRIRTLHDRALAYDPEVLEHDTLDFGPPAVLQPAAAPTIRVVTYPVNLRLKRAPDASGDERGSGFAIYSTTKRRVMYATFGHPEWAPTAQTVTAVYPRLFFSVAGDSHLYLLAVFSGPWESAGGQWVVFDARSGEPMTVPELKTGGRFR